MAIASDRELKKGNAELLILALLEDKSRHGYEIGKLIAERSEGVLRFHVASLYPLLYRLERRGWVKGEWEPAGGRRRRYYRLTPAGRKILAEQRSRWRAFSGAVNRIVEVGAAHRSAASYSMEAQHA
jgi:transcriptional regulator